MAGSSSDGDADCVDGVQQALSPGSQIGVVCRASRNTSFSIRQGPPVELLVVALSKALLAHWPALAGTRGVACGRRGRLACS